MRGARWMGMVALAALGATAAGCEETTTPPTQEPTPPVVTERFSGVITPTGALTFNFSAAVAGAVQATLSALGQDGTTMSLSHGTWNPGAGACPIVNAADNIGVGNSVTAQASVAGALCARLADVGKLAGSTTFEITIQHP